MIDTVGMLTKIVLALPGIVSAIQYIKSRASIKATQGDEAKPGYATSEFWLTIALNLPAAIAAVLGMK